MKRNDKILVTTTPILEGWKIEAYLGTVTSHIVSGTGLFSDLFASLSDVFGGRSQTYQKQLSAINEEVIESLKRKASSLGANCIIGLRIDHNEISGKDKQMFMVTAIGTAVLAARPGQNHQETNAISNIVSQDDFASSLKRRELIRLAYAGGLTFDDEVWNYVITNHVIELLPAITSTLEACYVTDYPGENDRSFIKRSKEFFYNLSEDIAKEYLYEILTRKGKVYRFARDLIGELSLLDIDQLNKLLCSGDFECQKRALQLLVFHKSYYNAADIKAFEELLPLIETGFKARGERITEKGMLSSKVKEFWKCECGEKIEISQPNCYSCYRDIYGFSQSEINLRQARAIISERVAALKEQFAD